MNMTNTERPFSWEPLGRVAVFVDAANAIYSLRDLGWRIDYKKLRGFFKSNTELIDTYFYIAHFDDDLGRKNLLEMLSRKGFVIRSKPVKNISKQGGGVLHKANCDVEIAMDVMTTYQTFDTAVLMSGDSDFLPLIEFLQSQGKKVIVISTRGHVAKEVVKAADKFFHFGFFRAEWELLPTQNQGAPKGSRSRF